MHKQSFLSRFRHFLVTILLLLIPTFAQAVSVGKSSEGNVYISIDDNENYYVITPQQLGVDVIHIVDYQGQSESDAEHFQLVYRFFFYTSAGTITVTIWEPSGLIQIERPLPEVMRFRAHPYYLWKYDSLSGWLC